MVGARRSATVRVKAQLDWLPLPSSAVSTMVCSVPAPFRRVAAATSWLTVIAPPGAQLSVIIARPV